MDRRQADLASTDSSYFSQSLDRIEAQGEPEGWPNCYQLLNFLHSLKRSSVVFTGKSRGGLDFLPGSVFIALLL